MEKKYITEHVETIYAQGSGEKVEEITRLRIETNYEFAKRIISEKFKGLKKILFSK